MPGLRIGGRFATRLCVAALLLIFAAELWFSVRRKSQTYDEALHLYAGYRYLVCSDLAFNPEHPPLFKLLAGLALLPYPALIMPRDCNSSLPNKFGAYRQGRDFLYGNDSEVGGAAGHREADVLLRRGRMLEAILAVALAALIYGAAAAMFSPEAGLIALLMAVFEPNLLAHGALVTSDTAVACFIFAAVFALYKYCERGDLRMLAAAGILSGVALAAKHSAVLLLPIVALLLALEMGKERIDGPVRRGPLYRRPDRVLLVMTICAVAVLWGFYSFRFSASPSLHERLPIEQYYGFGSANGSRQAYEIDVLPALARLHLLPDAYLYGLADVLTESRAGRPLFLLGRRYPRGQWFYFPVVLAVKLTLGTIVLMACLPFAARSLAADHARALRFLLVPPLIFLAFSMGSKLDIGVRHLLPIFPFLLILAAGGASALAMRSGTWRAVIVAALGFHAASSLHVFPDYLAYSNEIWGGTANTYRWLSDSNVDWGQDIPAAVSWLKGHENEQCRIAYFGTADLDYYSFPCPPLDSLARVADSATATPRFMLVSASFLNGVLPGNPNSALIERLRPMQPVAALGGSILVYRAGASAPGENRPADSAQRQTVPERWLGNFQSVAWLAGIVYTSIPVSWFAIHPFSNYWQARRKSPYRILLPAWIGILAGIGALTWRWKNLAWYSPGWPQWSIAAALFFCGALVYRQIGRFGLERFSGMAELRPTEHEQILVTTGLHARVRHPIYLAHLCMSLAWTVASGLTVLYLLLPVVAVLGGLMIRQEERELRHRFGDAYRQYASRTPAVMPLRFR